MRSHPIGIIGNATVDDLTLRVRVGPLFRADVPRRAIVAVRVVRPPLWAGLGVHVIRDGWVVSAGVGEVVEVRFHEPVTAATMGLPVHPRRLLLGVRDPDALVADLGG